MTSTPAVDWEPERGTPLRLLDRWIPPEVLADSADVRRRGRLLIAGVALSMATGVIGSIQHLAFGNLARGIFIAAAVPAVVATLGVLWTSRCVRWSTHYLLLVVLLGLHLSPLFDRDAPNIVYSTCVIGLMASHLISARAGIGWTVAAVTVASANALRLGFAESPHAEVAWTIATLTGLIGVSSVAIELTRRAAVGVAESASRRADAGRDRLRLLAERAFPGIIEVAPGRIDYASAGVLELVGYEAHAFAANGLHHYVHPDDFWPVVERLHSEPDRVHQVEARLRHARGHWTWIAAFAIPNPNHRGEDRWIFASRDVESERRERQRGVQVEKLEGVGLLAAGVAHDFNNLLTVIEGNADLLAESAERTEILHATSQAAGLTRQLLAFGKEQPHEMRHLDLRELVEGNLPILRSLLGEEITLRIKTSDAPCWVRGDPTQLGQVLLNLVTNARDAMPTGGRLEIALQPVELSPIEATSCGLEPGPAVQLCVADDGVGMDAATLTHAFDPFFTTKDSARGSGLGLASAYGIARQGGGHLDLESQPGAGTRATLLLPRVSAAEITLGAAPSALPVGGDQERVLVVEDDPRIRDIVRHALDRAGYEIVEAGDGAEALRIFGEQAPPALLVTDVVMPGARGSEIAERMRRQQPDLKVLFISGYSDEELGAWRDRDDGVAFLAKPFTPRQLTERASALLSSGA